MTTNNLSSNILPANYWERVREIRAAQNFKEFYSRYFSGYISIYVTAALSYTRITANQVTLSMFFWGILGGILFSQGEAIWYLLGSMSLMMLNVADAADGELARYTRTTSNGGDYLDRIAHYVTNAAAIIGLGVGLFQQYHEIWILGFAIAVEIAYTSDDAARDLLVTCGLEDNKVQEGRKKEKRKTGLILSTGMLQIGQKIIITLFGYNMAFFHLVGVCALIDIWFSFEKVSLTLIYFLIFGTISLLKLLARVYMIRKFYFI